MALNRAHVDDVTMSIDMSMRQLREKVVKIPKKDMGFKSAYEKAAGSVATLLLLLDEASRVSSEPEDSSWLS